MAAIALDGAGRRYGRRWALRECSLTVPAGRVAALVGVNGAGKTTLLHLLVGLSEPTAGRVRVLDGACPGAPAIARVGFVAQEAPLYRGFRVGEMLRLGARLNPRWDGRLARERLERFGIDVRARVGALSGGQRVQVALALALAKQPELLVLDEPMASLDPLARHEFLGALMEAVARGGLTVLLSSHLVSDLARVCDYLIVIARGRVQLAGDSDALLDVHRLLLGPRRAPAVPGVREVVTATRTPRQTRLLARLEHPVHHPSWQTEPVSLEDLALGYMSRSESQLQAVPQEGLA